MAEKACFVNKQQRFPMSSEKKKKKMTRKLLGEKTKTEIQLICS
jgi:hypothetical protein